MKTVSSVRRHNHGTHGTKSSRVMRERTPPTSGRKRIEVHPPADALAEGTSPQANVLPAAQVGFSADVRSSWILLGASRRGSSHIQSGKPREDVLGLAHFQVGTPGTEQSGFVLAVADGVGSMPLAGLGASLAVETLLESVLSAWARPDVARAPGPVLNWAAWAALRRIEAEAQERGQPMRALGTTLLAAIGLELPAGGLLLATFQAGNGLLARAEPDGQLLPWLDPEDEAADGSIYDFTHAKVRETWDHRRLKQVQLETPPWAILLLSDGISQDLIPMVRGGPVLCQALKRLSWTAEGQQQLLDLIGYEKRGSGDDRTLVGAFLRTQSFHAEANPAPQPETRRHR